MFTAPTTSSQPTATTFPASSQAVCLDRTNIEYFGYYKFGADIN